MSWLAALLTAVAGTVLAEWLGKEAQSWSPRLASRLVGFAVSRLPSRHRRRLGEEWHASLPELPTPISLLLFAVGVLVAAERFRWAEPMRTSFAGSLQRVGGLAIGLGASAAGVVRYRLKGIGWMLGSMSLTLGAYAVSLRTATVRNQVHVVDIKIAQAEQEIVALQHELTR